ncbi:MAG: hypothetical protein Kow0068_11720 [Marinilabiliales bacterium]
MLFINNFENYNKIEVFNITGNKILFVKSQEKVNIESLNPGGLSVTFIFSIRSKG